MTRRFGDGEATSQCSFPRFLTPAQERPRLLSIRSKSQSEKEVTIGQPLQLADDPNREKRQEDDLRERTRRAQAQPTTTTTRGRSAGYRFLDSRSEARVRAQETAPGHSFRVHQPRESRDLSFANSRARGLNGSRSAAFESSSNHAEPLEAHENRTGLPDALRYGIEHLSGTDLSDVNVHYNSDKPADFHALALTQGSDIHIAPKQEEHLAHEAWHVVQQKQGRVSPTFRTRSGVAISDESRLEKEASRQGERAAAVRPPRNVPFRPGLQPGPTHHQPVVQLYRPQASDVGRFFQIQIPTPDGSFAWVVATYRGESPGQFHFLGLADRNGRSASHAVASPDQIRPTVGSLTLPRQQHVPVGVERMEEEELDIQEAAPEQPLPASLLHQSMEEETEIVPSGPSTSQPASAASSSSAGGGNPVLAQIAQDIGARRGRTPPPDRKEKVVFSRNERTNLLESAQESDARDSRRGFSRRKFYDRIEMASREIAVVSGGPNWRTEDGSGRGRERGASLSGLIRYVLSTEGRLFGDPVSSGVMIGDHTSYLRAEGVLAAGWLRAVGGKIVEIGNNSGHFRPTTEMLLQMVSFLRIMGADLTMVMVWDQTRGAWYRADDFLRDPGAATRARHDSNLPAA